MHRTSAWRVLLLAGAALFAVAVADDTKAATEPQPRIERGRYLVHDVALCVQCHSPRDRHGKLLPGRLLTGGPIPVTTPFPGPRWAFTAPPIARMNGYTEEDLVRLLSRGVRRDGTPPRGPMPPFRLNEADARAIYAYLRSL